MSQKRPDLADALGDYRNVRNIVRVSFDEATYEQTEHWPEGPWIKMRSTRDAHRWTTTVTREEG